MSSLYRAVKGGEQRGWLFSHGIYLFTGIRIGQRLVSYRRLAHSSESNRISKQTVILCVVSIIAVRRVILSNEPTPSLLFVLEYPFIQPLSPSMQVVCSHDML